VTLAALLALAALVLAILSIFVASSWLLPVAVVCLAVGVLVGGVKFG
jgi:hypothetical protein